MSGSSKPTTIYHLEMTDRSAFAPAKTADGLVVHCVSPADFQLNRDFYYRVGRPWNWKDRLIWSEAQWKDHVQRDSLKTWIGRMDNETIGYFELESQTDGNVEIGLFGLLPQFIGRGWGGAFLSEAIVRAWDFKRNSTHLGAHVHRRS